MTEVADDSLEETNRLRIAAGLAPIGAAPADGAVDSLVDQDEVAAANFEERKAEMKRDRSEKEVKERIAKAKNQRALNAKMTGSTLGDSSKDDSLDAKAWIRKQKKRQKEREKELAERRAKEMEEADKLADYDERDLAGLKVGHGAEDFEEGQDVVLTLKDSKVLAEDGKSSFLVHGE